jgi:hypothetical protein
MENAKSAQTPRAGPDRGRQQRHQLEALLLRGAQRLRPVVGRGRLNCRNLLCNSSDGLVPPDDHTKLICTAALWVNPLVALRSFFVCARKLAQKYASLPACRVRGLGLAAPHGGRHPPPEYPCAGLCGGLGTCIPTHVCGVRVWCGGSVGGNPAVPERVRAPTPTM